MTQKTWDDFESVAVAERNGSSTGASWDQFESVEQPQAKQPPGFFERELGMLRGVADTARAVMAKPKEPGTDPRGLSQIPSQIIGGLTDIVGTGGNILHGGAAAIETMAQPNILTAGMRTAGGAMQDIGAIGRAVNPPPATGNVAVDFPSHVLRSTPQFGQQIAAGVAGGPVGFMAAGGAPMFGEAFDRAYQFRLQQGDKPEDAENRALLTASTSAGINMMLEKIPYAGFFAQSPAGKQFLSQAIADAVKRFGRAALFEGGTEALQAAIDDASQRWIADDPQAFKDALSRYALEGGVGAVLGTAARGGVELAARPQSAQTPTPDTAFPSASPSQPSIVANEQSVPLQTPYVSKFTQPVRDRLGENLAAQQVSQSPAVSASQRVIAPSSETVNPQSATLFRPGSRAARPQNVQGTAGSPSQGTPAPLQSPKVAASTDSITPSPVEGEGKTKDLSDNAQAEDFFNNTKTGQPVEVKAFRTEKDGKRDHARGVFYGDKTYVESLAGVTGDPVKSERLSFKNPLVIHSKQSFLKELAARGDKRAGALAANMKRQQEGMTLEKRERGEGMNFAMAERYIAQKARERGHDAVISQFEIEIADLRPSPPSSPASSRAEIQPGPDSGAAPRKVAAPSVESTKKPGEAKGGQSAKGGNLYAAGKEILSAGIAGGKYMARAQKIGEATADPRVRAEALEIFHGVSEGKMDVQEAERRLAAIEKKSGEGEGEKSAQESTISGVKRPYLYHGTHQGAARNIQREGLNPSKNKQGILADKEQYAKSYADRKGGTRGIMLRTRQSKKTKPDLNMTEAGDFYTESSIKPEDLEIKMPDGKWIPLLDADLSIGTPEYKTKPAARPTPSEELSEPPKGTQIPKMSDSELRWVVKNAAQQAKRQAAHSELIKREGAVSLLQSMEDAARERIKTRKRPAARTKGKLRGGSAPMFQDLADLSIIAAARAGKLGVRGYKKVRAIVEQIVNETAPHLKSSITRIAAQANRLRLIAQNDPDKFEQAASQLRKRAEIHDRRRFGTTIKAQIAEESGPRREKLTVKESEALKARIKGEVFAAKIGYKASTETGRLLALVKRIKRTKLRDDFMDTVAGSDAMFKSKDPAAKINDVAKFLRLSKATVDPEALALGESLTKAKLRDLNAEQSNLLREMVRTFGAMAKHHGSLMAYANGLSFKKAVRDGVNDLQSIKTLDTEEGAKRNRGAVKDLLADYQAMPDVRASATGLDKVMHEVFYEHLRQGQERALGLEIGVVQAMQGEMDKRKISDRTKWEWRSQLKRVDVGNGKPMFLTASEMMTFHTLWNRAEARQKIISNGWKSARYKGLLHEKRMVQGGQAVMAAYARKIKAMLTSDQRAIAATAIKAARKLAAPANATSVKLTGNRIFTEKDYTLPIRTELSDQQRNLEPTMQSFGQQWIESAGFTKTPVSHSHPILIGDFFSEFQKHAQGMATYAELAIPVRDALKMLGNPEYGNALRERFGDAFEQRTVKMMAKLSGMFNQPRTKMEHITAAIARRIAVGKLGLRITTYLSNRIGGLTLATPHLSAKENAAMAGYTARAVAGLDIGGFTKSEQSDLEQLESNPYLFHRWHVESYRLGLPTFDESSDSISRVRVFEQIKAVQDFVTSHMRYAERRNAVAIYRSMIAAGTSSQEAIARVADITRKTQNPVTPLEESAFVDDVKRNPLLTLAYLFVSQGNVIRNTLHRAMVQGDAKHIAAVSVAAAVNIGLMLAIREGVKQIKDLFADDDDKKKRARTAADHATSAAVEVADLIIPGFGNEVLGPMIRLLRKKPVFDQSAIGAIRAAFYSLPRDVMRLLEADENPRIETRDAARNLVGDIFDAAQIVGVPRQIGEVAESAIDATVDDDPKRSSNKLKRPTPPKPRRPPQP